MTTNTIEARAARAAEKWFADAEPTSAYDREQKTNAVNALAAIITAETARGR